MEWRDEGILLWVRRHGESNVIIEALTVEHGRHAGLVRGGASKANAAILQPGAQLTLEWNARLAEHLGTYKVDLVRSRAAAIISDRCSLAGLNAVSALLVQFLPDREPNQLIYQSTLELVDSMGAGEVSWPVRYALWELSLLESLGYGLDLSSCAASGTTDDLIFVSPRSGRAVCRQAGAAFADKMLPLPAFMTGQGQPRAADVREALRLTGYFMEHWVRPALEIEALPEARTRLIRLMDRIEMVEEIEETGPIYTPEEEAWLARFGMETTA